MKQSKLKYALTAALALAGAVGMSSAFASQTATANVQLTASVISQCTVSANQSNLAYLGLQTESDMTSLIQINPICNHGTTMSIEIDNGLHFGGVAAHATSRALSDGNGHFIAYDLFQDAAWTLPWGTGSTALSATAVNATGLGDIFTASAKLYNADLVPAGDYTDTVAVNVIY